MEVDFTKFTVSDYAAWWGAIIATFALLWNIIVALRSGARINLRVSPNMTVHPSTPTTEDQKYIFVKAVNKGTSTTTITHFCGFYSSSIWSLIRGKKKKFIVNSHPSLGNQIPCVLAPGEEWSNMAKQKRFEDNDKAKYLFLGIIHNQRNRPIYKRVKL